MSAFPQPHPKLRTLEPMVRRWRLHGRTDGAEEDNISGTIELDWLPGGHFLRQHTLIDFAGMVQVDGIELTIHMDAGATMRATISEDGRTFQGRWAPDPGHENDPGMVAYEFAGSRLDR